MTTAHPYTHTHPSQHKADMLLIHCLEKNSHCIDLITNLDSFTIFHMNHFENSFH